MVDANKKFITGAEMAVKAAIDAGAQMMYGYPITPATEIFTGWIKNKQNFLQTEDEISAGFAVCGGVLAGQKAFSASSGPGHVLMQDGFIMAEGMRLPFVLFAAQRGGPSSGTVIYSQQEVMLACYGGNGEGMRLVYSPSGPEELYALTRRAFNEAWKYRFPAIVLTDGYTLKEKSIVDFSLINDVENFPAYPLVAEGQNIHWPNIFTSEEELNHELNLAKADFDKITPLVATSEIIQTDDAEVILIAHGIVAVAAKEALAKLRLENQKVGLFRPITLRPFDKVTLDKTVGGKNVKQVIVIESSFGQLARLVKDSMDTTLGKPFNYIQYPALGIEIEEMVSEIKKIII